MPLAASSYAPLLGLGCQGLLVPGCHALRHRHKEAWPQQGGSRRHSTGHVCKKNRAKNARTGSRSSAFAGRGTSAHFRGVFVVLAVLAVAFGSTVIESNPARAVRIESFLAGRANFPRARRGCGISLISKTRSAAPDESETQPQRKATPRPPREHSRLVTQAPPRAPYSRRWDRTHTSPPPPRPPATLEEAAPRPNHSN